MGFAGKAEKAALRIAGAASTLCLAVCAVAGAPLVILGDKAGIKTLGYLGAAPCMAFSFLAMRAAKRLDKLEEQEKAQRRALPKI